MFRKFVTIITLICFLFFSGIIPSRKAYASGYPVYDIFKIIAIVISVAQLVITIVIAVQMVRRLKALRRVIGDFNPSLTVNFYKNFCTSFSGKAHKTAKMLSEKFAEPFDYITDEAEVDVEKINEVFGKADLPEHAREKLIDWVSGRLYDYDFDAVSFGIRKKVNDLLAKRRCAWDAKYDIFVVNDKFGGLDLRESSLNNLEKLLGWTSAMLYSAEESIKRGETVDAEMFEEAEGTRGSITGKVLFHGLDVSTTFLQGVNHPDSGFTETLSALTETAKSTRNWHQDIVVNTVALKIIHKQAIELTGLTALQLSADIMKELNTVTPSTAATQ